MLEILTGIGLALSAGLNAYVPLLLLGLGSRIIEAVALPEPWSWLENEWVLGTLGLLLIVEIVADKVPVVDSINDWLQTVVRPAAGGLAFGSGSTMETVAVAEPSQIFENSQWIPIATGVVLALGVHLAKMMVRPVLNAVTLGAAAPLVSAAEDAGSVVLSLLAIAVPILIILAAPLLVWAAIASVRALRARHPTSSDR